MAHSFTNLLYHFVFGTKYRTPWLEPSLRPALYAQLGHIIRAEGGIPLRINGVADHVHVLAKLRPDRTVSDMAGDMKARSSGWVHRTYSSLSAFCWQTGYGAFTVSQSQEPVVRQYIDNQEEHHLKISFQTELRTLLKKHGIEIDEETFWQ